MKISLLFINNVAIKERQTLVDSQSGRKVDVGQSEIYPKVDKSNNSLGFLLMRPRQREVRPNICLADLSKHFLTKYSASESSRPLFEQIFDLERFTRIEDERAALAVKGSIPQNWKCATACYSRLTKGTEIEYLWSVSFETKFFKESVWLTPSNVNHANNTR